MTYSGFHLADRQGALRLFQNLLPLLYATHDLHSDGVTQTELYLFLFAFARLASGSLHIGHTVPQGYHPFRKRYNAAGPLDNDVRIGRVSCPEGCAVGICDGDFNREDRGIVKLLRFEGNSGDHPFDQLAWQGTNLDFGRHPLRHFTNINLIDCPFKEKLLHSSKTHQGSSRLVGGQRHNRLTQVDHLLQNESIHRATDDRLNYHIIHHDPPVLEQFETLFADLLPDPDIIVLLFNSVELLRGDQFPLKKRNHPLHLCSSVLSLQLRTFKCPFCLRQLQRGGVRLDFNQRITRPDELPGLCKDLMNHPGNFGFHFDLMFRFDRPDRKSAFNNRTDLCNYMGHINGLLLRGFSLDEVNEAADNNTDSNGKQGDFEFHGTKLLTVG